MAGLPGLRQVVAECSDAFFGTHGQRVSVLSEKISERVESDLKGLRGIVADAGVIRFFAVHDVGSYFVNAVDPGLRPAGGSG